MTHGHSPEGQARGGGSVGDARVQSTPALAARTQPNIPRPRLLWKSFCFWTWSLYLIVILTAVPDLFVQFWFNQSLGYQTIFWTNMMLQLFLLLSYSTAVIIAITLPMRWHAVSPTLRRASVHCAVWIGIILGWLLAERYQQFLLAVHGVPFGTADPVFGLDIGFYTFLLPALRTILSALEVVILLGVVSLLVARYDELHSKGILQDGDLTLRSKLCLFAPPSLQVLVYGFGAVVVFQTYLGRYDLLLTNNEASGVRLGAEYLDLVGLFSTLNMIYLTAFVQAGLTAVAGWLLYRAHRAHGWVADRRDTTIQTEGDGALSWRKPVLIGAALLALELGFATAVLVRDTIFVTPNEPYVQLEYIQRHIDATIKGYGLGDVEVHEWKLPETPLSPEELLSSKTVQNAPFLPTWATSLEEPPDIQHYERIKVSDARLVFGPMLQIYKQQQQLRPYYDFLSVDGVRYTVDGQKQMFVSAVRELPSLALVGEKDWLKYWGSASLLFTHGFGLVMSPANRIDESGSPYYVVQGVPPQVTHHVFDHEPRIYFGEGARDDYVLTNVRYLQEFDYATEQAREEFMFPEDLTDGIRLDSFFKRLIFSLYTQDVTAFLFSRYIDPERTRIHIHRTPIARIRSLAPFLFLDTNVYAFIADKNIVWMVNGLTTSDRYPYSFQEVLGDKADERAVEEFPERLINYAEDSVKVTVDAYSGEVHLYRMTEDPLVSTWERIYPDLFEPASAMPVAVEAQLTYPLQWFHIQFDDIYKRYHQHDPIEFYNVEDLWDDADETIGSIGRGLSGFGTADQMTFSYEGYNVLLDPSDLPPGVDIGEPGDLRYAMLMPFTPEASPNLRALVIALQDPGVYGRLISLQIPQGTFVPGPEQVDAYIDNDRPVHQQVTMWIRHASEVMRGSTLLLPVGGDLLYLETIWISSIQNELPQLKLFAVRYHDRITSGASLEEAIRKRELISGVSNERANDEME